MSGISRSSLGISVGRPVAALLALVMIWSSSPGSAQTLIPSKTTNVQATAGQRMLVESLSAVDAAICQSTVPPITLTEQPAHGKVEIIPRENEMHRTLDPDGQRCIGMITHAAGIYYTSLAGFHGMDRFSFTAQLHGGKVQRVVIINVQ
jgi:hypothetical protein